VWHGHYCSDMVLDWCGEDRTVGAAIRESDRNKRIERRMALLQKLGASMRRSSPSQLTLSRSFAG
jgi:hypothetical protein